MKKYIVFIVSFYLCSLTTIAQENKENLKVDLSVDMVSSYVWRGLLYDNSFNFQPCVTVGFGKGFSLSSWASQSLSSEFSEVDFTIAYNFKNFNLSISDYFVKTDSEQVSHSWLNYSDDRTNHALELSGSYSFGDRFPLSIVASSFIYGNDRDEMDDNNYSSYLELNYSFDYKDFDISYFIGTGLNEGLYSEDGIQIVNVGVSLSKSITLNEKFNLPISGSISLNPYKNDIFFVLKCNI